MDQLTRHRELLKRILNEYIELANRPPNGGVESALVADDEHGHYIWIKYGWANRKRIRATTIYARLYNGKIWIEEDWTEDGIATDLVREGVPKDDIVLAFHPPDMRPYTDFAAA